MVVTRQCTYHVVKQWIGLAPLRNACDEFDCSPPKKKFGAFTVTQVFRHWRRQYELLPLDH